MDEENIEISETPKVMDRGDGREVYYYKSVPKPFSCALENPDNKEVLLFQWYDLRKSGKDKRPLLLRIVHMLAEKKGHRIDICVDLENHHPKAPLHLNISYLAEKATCPFCNEYLTKNYPEGLNHFPLTFKRYNEQDTDKFIDYAKLLEEIELHLTKQGVFKIFSEVIYGPPFFGSS